MTFIIYKVVGSLIAPPGIFFVALLFCTVLAWRKPRKYFLTLLLLFFAFTLYFISTPYGASKVTGPLEDMYSPNLPLEGTKCAILVLSGGSTSDNEGNVVQPGALSIERVFSAVKVAKRIDAPIIFSGGNVYGTDQESEAQIMADCAREMEYSGEIILEEKSRTTKENLLYVSDLLKPSNFESFSDSNFSSSEQPRSIILVTNAFHMRRSILADEKHIPTIKIFPFPSGRLTEPVYKGFHHLLADGNSLMSSCLGIKEWIGIALYKIR